MSVDSMQTRALKAAFEAATHAGSDPAFITNVLPDIIARSDKASAFDLGNQYGRESRPWMPEAMTLFNVDSMPPGRRGKLLARIFEGVNIKEKKFVRELADVSARIGRIGFSFPEWRFAAQGFNGSSLLERYGYTKLERATDVQDETLPKSNPDRDKYGTGFVKHNNEWTIEYRRAYILCANRSVANPAAIIIRNNSFFFGRDRLPEPAYVSFKPHTAKELENLDRRSFHIGGDFMPLQCAFLSGNKNQRLASIQKLLTHFDKADMNFSRWLFSGEGKDDLLAFANHALERQSDTTKAPFYLGTISSNQPPWFPRQVLPVRRDTLDDIASYAVKPSLNTRRFDPGSSFADKGVLLSGPSGDLPLKPGFSLT